MKNRPRYFERILHDAYATANESLQDVLALAEKAHQTTWRCTAQCADSVQYTPKLGRQIRHHFTRRLNQWSSVVCEVAANFADQLENKRAEAREKYAAPGNLRARLALRTQLPWWQRV